MSAEFSVAAARPEGSVRPTVACAVFEMYAKRLYAVSIGGTEI